MADASVTTTSPTLATMNESYSAKRPEDEDAGADAAERQRALLPKIVCFKELARCGDEVWIEHAGQLYRLRRTRQGKLILTK